MKDSRNSSGRGRGRWAAVLGAVLVVLGAAGCSSQKEERTEDGRLVLNYWEKWTGFEGEAMQAVVDEFNASQDRIFVKKLSVSTIDQKMMLAVAGGNPPDIAGLWSHNVAPFAERGTLTPLGRRLREAGLGASQYTDVFWDLCRYRDFTWALPSTPATIGLHWNKKHFRDAGLDPDRPPRSIAELDRMAEQLTVVEVERNGEEVRVRYTELTDAEKRNPDDSFTIVILGYSPSVPGWWNYAWSYWFGGRLWNGRDRITATNEANVAAYEWFQSYPRKFGAQNLQQLAASFGNFSSPQNPFLSGKVSMVQQGVWMHNFIKKYNPQLDWGAAPFPSVDPDRYPMVTIAETDVLVIPYGAKHPDEAFEFITYVNEQSTMEKLSLGQRKFSARSTMSEGFFQKHPNPYIRVFTELAQSPNAVHMPKTPIWTEYMDELVVAADEIYLLQATPEEALQTVQRRIQSKLDRSVQRWRAVREERLETWRERR